MTRIANAVIFRTLSMESVCKHSVTKRDGECETLDEGQERSYSFRGKCLNPGEGGTRNHALPASYSTPTLRRAIKHYSFYYQLVAPGKLQSQSVLSREASGIGRSVVLRIQIGAASPVQLFHTSGTP